MTWKAPNWFAHFKCWLLHFKCFILKGCHDTSSIKVEPGGSRGKLGVGQGIWDSPRVQGAGVRWGLVTPRVELCSSFSTMSCQPAEKPWQGCQGPAPCAQHCALRGGGCCPLPLGVRLGRSWKQLPINLSLVMTNQ